MMHGIDEQIISELTRHLSSKDRAGVQDVIDDLLLRIDGVCFCAAHSDSECICGAWDGDWDEEDEYGS